MLKLFQLSAVACVTLALAQTATAGRAKRASHYTGTVGKGCAYTFENGMRCKGVNGWFLDISDEGNIITVQIDRKSSTGQPLIITGRSLGEQAEWRGTRRGAGFRADALIIRMRPVEDDAQSSNMLFIVKLGGSGACFSALVDAKVNPDANLLARAAADKLPDVCEPYPQVYGKRSAATDMFGS